MAYDSIMVRYGEMFLKSGNLYYFERRLLQNIRAMTGLATIIKTRGRLLLPYFPGHRSLVRIFGISSYCLAHKAEKSLDAIREAVVKALQEKPTTTFKIKTIRSDKTFPLESRQVNIAVGQYIEKTTAWQCEFNAPAVMVRIEINRKGAYIFTESIPGIGGLPVGTAGKVHLLLENDADLLAGLLMMKRGCEIIPLCIGKEKDVSLLQKFSAKKIPSIIFKKKSELPRYLQQQKNPLLVIGENFEKRKKYDLQIVIFRPLIAYIPQQITEATHRFTQISSF